MPSRSFEERENLLHHDLADLCTEPSARLRRDPLMCDAKLRAHVWRARRRVGLLKLPGACRGICRDMGCEVLRPVVWTL